MSNEIIADLNNSSLLVAFTFLEKNFIVIKDQ
jgi:hypothetical protein